MSIYHYPKYKILISPDSKRTQGLQVGDVVRRQYFDSPKLIYSLMVVLETGVNIIGENESHYFTGALLEGDEPKTGEVLDFVRITNLFNRDRSGALYLTASDAESPYMDVIDGMASENSLCYPAMDGGITDIPDKDKYAVAGTEFLTTGYTQDGQEAGRIFRITRNNVTNPGNAPVGLKQTIEKEVSHPQRLVISYKIRASKSMENVPVGFSYTSGEETDGADTINITEEWKYLLHIITVDYPPQYRRSFSIDLTVHLLSESDWVEIADLNIVLQADLANFANASKVRIGKVKGIIDPVFGVLEGYGAYFQNLYATKNVNIAGTLTAGDENGFSSTFYVGKIHKNVILNSIDCAFEDEAACITEDKTPVGIGKIRQIGNSAQSVVQSAQWRTAHTEQKYCFSVWIKSNRESLLTVYQDEHCIGAIDIDSTDWKRYSVSFFIRQSENAAMVIRLETTETGVKITAPQLEAGATPSQYQPTDGTLSYVEDYGAWFSKGGIGGTIQNPLLRLNEDGSISSRDNSFVIKPDGTGHFASGRFQWTKDTISLQDVTIRWEDFDDEAKDNLLPKSVSLSGTDVFHYPDELENTAEPTEIYIYAAEHNFTATTRKWQYLASGSLWKNIAGTNQDFIKILPSAHYWESRNVLSVKYIAVCDGKEYTGIFTVFKQFDGQSAYSIQITSSSGSVFKNGIVSSLLQATVQKGGMDVTDKIPEANFKWIRKSDNPESDELWNSASHTGKT
ncbi:hypothetical protein, partial [Viscerimonas tarda]